MMINDDVIYLIDYNNNLIKKAMTYLPFAF